MEGPRAAKGQTAPQVWRSAADPPEPAQPSPCYPTAVTRSEDGGEIRKMYDLGPEGDLEGQGVAVVGDGLGDILRVLVGEAGVGAGGGDALSGAVEKNNVLPVVAVVAVVLLGGGAFYFIKRRR